MPVEIVVLEKIGDEHTKLLEDLRARFEHRSERIVVVVDNQNQSMSETNDTHRSGFCRDLAQAPAPTHLTEACEGADYLIWLAQDTAKSSTYDFCWVLEHETRHLEHRLDPDLGDTLALNLVMLNYLYVDHHDKDYSELPDERDCDLAAYRKVEARYGTERSLHCLKHITKCSSLEERLKAVSVQEFDIQRETARFSKVRRELLVKALLQKGQPTDTVEALIDLEFQLRCSIS